MTFERKLFVTITAEIAAPDDRMLADAVSEALVSAIVTDGWLNGGGGGIQVQTHAGVVTIRQSFRNEYWADGKMTEVLLGPTRL